LLNGRLARQPTICHSGASRALQCDPAHDCARGVRHLARDRLRTGDGHEWGLARARIEHGRTRRGERHRTHPAACAIRRKRRHQFALVRYGIVDDSV